MTAKKGNAMGKNSTPSKKAATFFFVVMVLQLLILLVIVANGVFSLIEENFTVSDMVARYGKYAVIPSFLGAICAMLYQRSADINGMSVVTLVLGILFTVLTGFSIGTFIFI